MNFKFPKRNATFGAAFKNRAKKAGGEKTITLKVSHSVSPKDLDMLIPTQGVLTSEFLFGADYKIKPALQTYVLFPIYINRKPEGVTVTIHDQKAPLKLEKVDITDIVVDIDEDGKKLVLSYNMQLHPGKNLQRISEYIEGNTLGYQCVNTQEELFGQEPPAREGDQTDIGDSDDQDEDD